MRLLLVELNRLRSRRAVVLLVVIGLLLVAWMTISTVWETRPVSSSEVAAAKARAEQDREVFEEDFQRCQESPEEYAGPGATAADCPQQEPDYRWYLSRGQLSLTEERQDTGLAAVFLLAALALIVGATFAGADWSTGSMSNQLLFRPRRTQVWAAKAVAVTIGVTVVAAVLLAAMWVTYASVASARGIGVPDQVGWSISRFNLRGLALVAGAGLGGFALTMLLRSTVGTLALLFAYSVGGEALVAALPFDRVSQWGLASNVFAWLENGHEVYDGSIPCIPDTEGICDQTYLVSLTHGATYLGVLLVLAAALSAWLFSRRDIP